MSAIHIFSVKDVPLFLQETEFFRSLDKDDDVITLPKHVCKFDTTIATTDQAISCLSTMRFWGVTKPPVELIKFVLTNPAKEMTELLGGFSKELKQVQWLQEVCRRIHTKNVPSVESFSPHEATSFTYGIIGLLCEQHRRTGQVWCPEVCALAAHFSWEAGLAFLHERGFPWDESTCAQAARSGSLRCLSYARDHNFPWDVRTVNLAMIGGHRECLAYAVSHNCPRPPRFAWLSSCGPALGAWNEETCAKFAFAGQLHALKFAHENGCPWDKNVIIQACLKGNLPCFLYAVENDCPGKEDACLLIAGWYPQWEETSRPDDWMSNLSKGLQDVFGDIFHTPPPVLHYECPTDAHVARVGISPKHNRTLWLELARRHGCPWDKRIFQVAAQSAHLDVFQYALENGCPGCDDVVIAAARNWTTLQYVVFRGCALLPEAYVSAATSDEPLKAVKFLHARGCPWDERACTAFAKFKRHGLCSHCGCHQSSHKMLGLVTASGEFHPTQDTDPAPTVAAPSPPPVPVVVPVVVPSPAALPTPPAKETKVKKVAKSQAVVKSIRPSKVPALLRNGAFYESLDVEDDTPVPVPVSKANLNVRTNKDLDQLLSCLRFWGVSIIPDRVLATLILTTRVSITLALVDKFEMCFPILKSILHFQRFRADSPLMKRAIKTGSAEIVEFLLRRGYKFLADSCDDAAERGSAKLLKLAHESGVKVTALTFSKAANLNAIKYLHEINCPYQADIVTQIALSGKVDALDYAIEHFPFTPLPKVCDQFVYCGQFEVMKRLHSVGFPLDGVLHSGAQYNRLQFVKYALEHGALWKSEDLYLAAAHGHSKIVEYALEHGCPYDPAMLAKLRRD